MSSEAATADVVDDLDRDEFEHANAYRGAVGVAHACRRWGMLDVHECDDVRGTHVDAVATEPYRTPSGFELLEDDESVEVKTAAVEYGDGRAGRIKLKRANHDRLVDEDGSYAIVVLDDEANVLRAGLLKAHTVDAVVDGTWWDSGQSRRDDGPFRQLPWTQFFDSLDEPNGWSA